MPSIWVPPSRRKAPGAHCDGHQVSGCEQNQGVTWNVRDFRKRIPVFYIKESSNPETK